MRRPARRPAAPLPDDDSLAARPWIEPDADGLLLALRLAPRSAREGILEASAKRLRVAVMAAPVEDAANRALVRLLAAEFGVPKARISVVAGARSRSKRVRIERPARLPRWLVFDPGAGRR